MFHYAALHNGLLHNVFIMQDFIMQLSQKKHQKNASDVSPTIPINSMLWANAPKKRYNAAFLCSRASFKRV
jgi:hypothetical protein